ncbi:hypothetical protein NQZ68_026096 [Dissostichus eleginoides]|nr:hypothetical protein NQZ68_026096 [Dissostichus eleginoides]
MNPEEEDESVQQLFVPAGLTLQRCVQSSGSADLPPSSSPPSSSSSSVTPLLFFTPSSSSPPPSAPLLSPSLSLSPSRSPLSRLLLCGDHGNRDRRLYAVRMRGCSLPSSSSAAARHDKQEKYKKGGKRGGETERDRERRRGLVELPLLLSESNKPQTGGNNN